MEDRHQRLRRTRPIPSSKAAVAVAESLARKDTVLLIDSIILSLPRNSPKVLVWS